MSRVHARIYRGENGGIEIRDLDSTNGIELSIESSVINQFGRKIKATVLETLERLEVKDAKVKVVDKGALDCTLKARVEGAVFRASGYSEDEICSGKKLPWGGVIR